ncbi:MAG: hypothetical protein IJD59_08460 [Clostridia bacterium]|nr:hypothetical protein [Clostridia bacterium]
MNSNSIETKENVLAGAVGAFLFSLVGGILWFVLYQIGYVAALSGLVGVICAVKGYTFFAKTKNESKTCLVLSVIIAVLVLAISWYLCIGYDIYLAYQEWFAAGEVDFTLNFFESVRVIPLFLAEKEILVGYLANLGLGLLFAGLGVISYLSSREKKMKKQAAEAAVRAEAKAKAEAEANREADRENEYATDSE